METSISERFLGILLSSIVLQYKTIWRRTSGRHGTGTPVRKGDTRDACCSDLYINYNPATLIQDEQSLRRAR